MKTLGIIGIGNMGEVIIRGVDNKSFARLYGYDAFSDKRAFIEEYGGIWLNSELEVVEKCKYILLAVKPQSVDELLRKIAPAVTADKVIISICAGITAEFIRSRTLPSTKVIRIMPNTPMMLGLGASAVSTDELTSRDELQFALSVFGGLGINEVIPPDKMNEIICINASSPAFIYLFAKGFTDYAVQQGISEKAALNLFSQTLIGSGKMLMDSGMSVDDLISQVASKGGTTEAGLSQLHEKGLLEAVKSACEACTARAWELGREE
ncbi:MAG: pyrroline-5-carboxylate reductase [Oscillospiraceae bacterium]|nr:pyrroline-5-carboxylate reductase [Oscillospiraceae bacterium]